ncbi:MAG: glycosyltransferase family 9 protein [Candidatus Hydrogenedentes bacterium]|nr:glycosyltransferase family 9 protein [Candidatus Hydrogenedentota bacterium]
MLTRIAGIALREARANLNYHLVTRLGRLPEPRTRPPHTPPQRVGIVRLDLIGDFVLFTAALPHFRAAFPGAELVLFGNAAWRDLALWLNDHRVVCESQLLFDEFVDIEPARLVDFGYFSSAVTQLRTTDLVVNAAYSRTNVGDKLIAAAGRESIGCSGDTTNILAGQKLLNDKLYSRLIPNSESKTEWERNIDLAQALAPAASIPRTPPFWRLNRDLADASIAGLFKANGVSSMTPTIAISPFASLPIKQWPLAQYRSLIQCILDARGDLRALILGGADRVREAELLTKGFPSAERVINLVGKTSLVEATCLLCRSRVSISGDTAAGHLASAVGTPAVVVMGGGHYGRFYPYAAPHPGAANHAVIHRMDCFHCNWFCKYRRFSNQEPPCLQEITVDDVFARVAPLLSK